VRCSDCSCCYDRSKRTTESEIKHVWSQEWLNKNTHGNYATLYKELHTDEQLFQKYLHIPLPMYEFLYYIYIYIWTLHKLCPNATARGGYIRADRLLVDTYNQASLMFDAWKGNKVNLTPGLAHSDPLLIEARIFIKQQKMSPGIMPGGHLQSIGSSNIMNLTLK